MTFTEYIQQVGFHTVQPDTPMGGSWGVSYEERADAELLNLRLPDTMVKERLQVLRDVPRLSTFANAAIINYGVSCLIDGTCYLNVGTWHGFSLFAGMVGNPDKYCIGVDNFSGLRQAHVDERVDKPVEAFLARFNQIRGERHTFHQMDYLEYLKTVHQTPIGFYFYDGEHNYLNQLQGLRLAEPFFTDDCIVMVDDTNWPAPRNATLDFIAHSKNTYRILLDQQPVKEGDFAHPTFWNGIIVFERTS